MSRRLTKQACAALRTRLSNLGYGHATASDLNVGVNAGIRPPAERPARRAGSAAIVGPAHP